ncbi:MAG TPA: hypothetical protein VHC20_00485 [Candidatus Paceibacterota bacterium]|nr:hypothetical protein [Candidatus Paceibacterota bacterium]
MRSLSLGLLFAAVAFVGDVHAVEQKTITVVNDTPYSIVEFNVWPESDGPSSQVTPFTGFPDDNGMVTGSLGALETARVYVDKRHCMYLFTGETDFGRLFTGEINTCDPAVTGVRLSTTMSA